MKKVITALILTVLTTTTTFAQEGVSQRETITSQNQEGLKFVQNLQEVFNFEAQELAHYYFEENLVVGKTDFFNYSFQAQNAKIINTFFIDGIEFNMVEFENSIIFLADDALLYTKMAQKLERTVLHDDAPEQDKRDAKEHDREVRENNSRRERESHERENHDDNFEELKRKNEELKRQNEKLIAEKLKKEQIDACVKKANVIGNTFLATSLVHRTIVMAVPPSAVVLGWTSLGYGVVGFVIKTGGSFYCEKYKGRHVSAEEIGMNK